MTRGRQTVIGLALAAAILGAWTALHVWGVFLHEWRAIDVVRAPAAVLMQTWLFTGLFIVAHDAIHGSLAPGRPRLQSVIGQICVGLYAGFDFRRLASSHARHHAAPGGAEDPDFHAPAPRAFAPWLAAFFLRHFGLAELARVSLMTGVFLLLGARLDNLLVFWALPSLLSALQLFTFGTYLPHRHETAEFADAHQARSLDQSWLVSLLTCFHFGGRHHEHHLHPDQPWWRLPSAVRSGSRAAAAAERA